MPMLPASKPSSETAKKSHEMSELGTSLLRTRGGKVSPASDDAAFIHVAPKRSPLPILISVPHAGRVYPGDVLAQMRDPQTAQVRLEDRYVDMIGVAVAKATGTGLLVAQAPRAMLDLNRSHDDVDWEMIEDAGRRGVKRLPGPMGSNARARSGLGLVPRRLPGFGEIWRSRLPEAELDRRIKAIHRPYHTFLARELERIRLDWGAALLIDLHSMPPLNLQRGGRRYLRSSPEPVPQIVLGDRFGASCQPSLIARASRYLEAQSCVAAHNRPYSGGYVLDRHAAPSQGVHCLQLELCRSTYLDASFSEPTASVKPLANMLVGLVRELGTETARLGARDQVRQAAE